MGKAVKIEDGIVKNVLVIDDSTPKELFDVEIEDESTVDIGWKYEDGEFIAPEVVPVQEPESE